MDKQRVYIAIDLKSFYASVECVERKLDAMDANLVVADSSRTEKTICLAVSPSLKAYGLSGRARLFEVVQKVNQINAERKFKAPNKMLTGKSCFASELSNNPSLALDYVVAPPHMAKYMQISTQIYNVYKKYVSPDDIVVYSIDEVFIDATDYVKLYGCSARKLAMTMILDVLKTTGITATAGIGTNLYLAKVAMDIGAKHIKADKNGVRIAELDETAYRKKLWNHEPLTDFWRVGRGYANKLQLRGMYTMGDVARCSLENEDLLYGLFGINAELLIDHAWGYEPCEIKHVKAYKPQNNCISSGQVLQCPYDYEKTKIIVKEMTELLCLDLIDKRIVTNQIVLTVGYDVENLTNPEICKKYRGEVVTDYYGRKVPKHAHGTENLGEFTSSTKKIMQAVLSLFERICNKNLLARRVNITANNLIDEAEGSKRNNCRQLSIFDDEQVTQSEEQALGKERRLKETELAIQKRYGKNALLKGTNLQEGATTRARNGQIGGHKA